jgi:uncharacterized protein YidB (DUF937 family)
MDAAAKLLGMSSSDLRSALQSGKSLADIASSKGIGRDTLTAAMAAAIQQANPNVSSERATEVATAIATRTPLAGGPPTGGAQGADATQGATGTTATQGHHHHHHHAGGAAMDAAAKTLGMSTSDLMSSLQSGQSLASIAKSKGVSQDDLVKAMAAALQGADSKLSSDQATQIATQMATRTPGTENQPWATAAQQSGTTTYSITA